MLRLMSRLQDRTASVVVVGLGYVGLPMAVALGDAGFRVVGVDVSKDKVDAVNRGVSTVLDVSSERLNALVLGGRLSAVTHFGQVSEADVVVMCVPTPLGANRQPDLSYIQSAVDGVLPNLRAQTLVCLESTTYPGTTEELLVEPLRRAGWETGTDVFVCYSPERVDPGNRKYTVENTPKVVGGYTPACLELGLALYRSCIHEVVPVSSTKAAEMSKLLENTFRAVNIAFVNEMALLCERLGIDVWEVIQAAATKPFGFMPFYPGPGIGGHCIPLDPAYLAWKARESGFYSRFIELAQELNESMPRHVVRTVSEALNLHGKAVKNSAITLLGMAYKPDVDDIRESPSLEVFELLTSLGANVLTVDPFVREFRTRSGVLVQVHSISEAALQACDCIVILTAHSSVDYKAIVNISPLVVDTRNAIKWSAPNVVKLGAPFPQNTLTLPLS